MGMNESPRDEEYVVRMSAYLLVLLVLSGCGSSSPSPLTAKGNPTAIYALAARSDDKLVAVGQADVGDVKSGVVLVADRYGTPNAAFGTNGGVLYNVPGSTNTKFDHVVVQSDYNVVVGGNSTLVRFTVYGTIDTTFGNQGVVTTPYPIAALLLQSDNKVVIAGSDSGKFSVTRYTTAGALDPTVGGGTGTNSFDFANAGGTFADNVPAAMAINGNFLVMAGAGNSNKLALASLKLADLSLDLGSGRFGVNDPGTGQPSGKNYVASLNAGKYIFATPDNTLRIVGDGYLAQATSLGAVGGSGFGSAGIVDTTSTIGGTVALATYLGNGIWLGSPSLANDGHFTVANYRTDNGTLVSYFGGTGVSNPLVGSNASGGAMLALLSNGFVMLAVNFSDNSGKQTSVIPLNADGSVNESFKMSSTLGPLGPPAQ